MVSHIVLAQNVEFLTTIVGGDLTADRVAATGISSNTLFVTDQPAFGYGSLRALDISNIYSPKLIGYDERFGYFGRFVLAAGHAYVTHTFDLGGALSIYGVDAASTPTLKSGYGFQGGLAYDVAVEGGMVYVATDLQGLHVLDVSHSTSPTSVGSFSTVPARASRVAISPDQIYLACESVKGSSWVYELLILSRPKSPAITPILQGTYALADRPGNMIWRNGLLYLPDDDLKILDFSDPVRPRLVGQFHTPGRARSIAISGKMIFLFDFRDDLGSLLVADISNPAAPQELGSYDCRDYEWPAIPCIRQGREIFVPTSNAGVVVLRYTGPLITAAGSEWDLY